MSIAFSVLLCEHIIMFPKDLKTPFTVVTPMSKILAAMIFVAFPFLGFFLGIKYQKNFDLQTILTLRREISIMSKEIEEINQDKTDLLNKEGTLETYTSKDLGISFSYFQPEKFSAPLKVKEIGDKIYLYVNSSKTEPDEPTKGQFIQVFNKDPQQDLKETIKTNFLQNYSLEDCIVATPSLGKRYSTYNPNNEYLRIDLPGPVEDVKTLEEKSAACPDVYTNTRKGTGYFVMDKNHSDRYAFVNLGQSGGFMSYPGLAWDMTIRFND